MNLPKHPEYGMYYAVYPDGGKSKDFYNYTRALEHTKVLASSRITRAVYGPRELTGALFY